MKMDSVKKVAIYGAGGFGREIACLINWINLREKSWNLVGFFDDGLVKGTTNNYGKILGNINDLNNWKEKLAIIIGIGEPRLIHKIIQQISNPLIYFPNLVPHEITLFDKGNTRMGRGNVFQVGCSLTCNIDIGDFNIFNGHIGIGHDAKIGSFNVIMPSVLISGGVEIGDQNFIGVSAVILQNVKIGKGVHVGAGSVVLRRTQDHAHYFGVPALKLRL